MSWRETPTRRDIQRKSAARARRALDQFRRCNRNRRLAMQDMRAHLEKLLNDAGSAP
jgi:hypothetical protein